MRRRRNRKAQSLVILVLCFLVCGLTLGFASFSSTLTISSSADVKPNASDFDINVYGIGDASLGGSYDDISIYTSTSISEPALEYYNADFAAVATITDDGKDITISDLNVSFSEPSDAAAYYFMIKNDGAYDAYLDVSPLQSVSFGVPGICTPKPGTSSDLVSATCESVVLTAFLLDSELSEIVFMGPTYKLEKGDYLLLQLYIEYLDSSVIRADGDFTVRFDDITLDFTSVPPEE